MTERPVRAASASSAAGDTQWLFAGPGEMRGRCSTFDWSATPLGPVETWPQSLRTTVSTMLASGFPCIVLWGPELIQIYNDRYREVMGTKHPFGLGIPTRECWPEAWEFNGPVYDRVFSGETAYFENVLIPIVRYGTLEDVYFTISYGPVRGESGAVDGVLITLLETTGRVAAEKLEAERARLLIQVEAERNRLSEVFEHAPGFFAVLRGSNHVIERANDAYLQLVGYRDVIGRPVDEALPEVRAQGFIDLLDGVLGTGTPFIARELPAMLTHKRGEAPEPRFVNLVYQAITEPDGSRSGIVVHGVDVTDQVNARRDVERLLRESEESRGALEMANTQLEEQQMEMELTNQQLQDNATELEAQTEELAVQAQELEEQSRLAHEANRAKSEFLATMSHELRTPLNAIGGYADLLLAGVRGELAEPQRIDVERMKRSGQHLLSLINNILNFAKLDAGEVEFRTATMSAASLIEGLDDLIAPQVASKSLRLTFSACDPTALVTADPDKVRQILLNLLSNAVKFTNAGGEIALTSECSERWVRITVRDTGRGIHADQMSRIFDPFVQVDRHLTPASQQGVGLGLAISRDLARGMGGELSAESTPGKGSAFTLMLHRADGSA